MAASEQGRQPGASSGAAVPPSQGPEGALRDATRRNAGLWPTIKAVASSFFGVRGSKAHDEDMTRLNPIVVIAVGIGLAAVFVGTLLLIVRYVTAH